MLKAQPLLELISKKSVSGCQMFLFLLLPFKIFSLNTLLGYSTTDSLFKNVQVEVPSLILSFSLQMFKVISPAQLGMNSIIILIAPSRFKTFNENIIESIGLISILFPLVPVFS